MDPNKPNITELISTPIEERPFSKVFPETNLTKTIAIIIDNALILFPRGSQLPIFFGTATNQGLDNTDLIRLYKNNGLYGILRLLNGNLTALIISPLWKDYEQLKIISIPFLASNGCDPFFPICNGNNNIPDFYKICSETIKDEAV